MAGALLSLVAAGGGGVRVRVHAAAAAGGVVEHRRRVLWLERRQPRGAVDQAQVEGRPHPSGTGDEREGDGDVPRAAGRAVVAVGVEEDCPLVPAHGEADGLDARTTAAGADDPGTLRMWR